MNAALTSTGKDVPRMDLFVDLVAATSSWDILLEL